MWRALGQVESDWVGNGVETEKVVNKHVGIYQQFMHYLYKRCVTSNKELFPMVRARARATRRTRPVVRDAAPRGGSTRPLSRKVTRNRKCTST